MDRRLSRILGGIEIVMLLTPVSISALGGLYVLTRLGALQEQPGPYLGILLYLALPVGVAIAALIALWRTLGAFVLGGPQALLQVSRMWWRLLMAGCVFAVGAILYFGAERLGLVSSDSVALFIPMGIGALGVVLLVPVIHIAVEYRLAMRSNYRIERTSES